MFRHCGSDLEIADPCVSFRAEETCNLTDFQDKLKLRCITFNLNSVRPHRTALRTLLVRFRHRIASSTAKERTPTREVTYFGCVYRQQGPDHSKRCDVIVISTQESGADMAALKALVCDVVGINDFRIVALQILLGITLFVFTHSRRMKGRLSVVQASSIATGTWHYTYEYRTLYCWHAEQHK